MKTHLCPAEPILITNQEKKVLSTCRSDGRLLSPGRGLTVTPLQVMIDCPDDILYSND